MSDAPAPDIERLLAELDAAVQVVQRGDERRAAAFVGPPCPACYWPNPNADCPVCDGTGRATLRAVIAIGLEALDNCDYMWAADTHRRLGNE